MRNYGLLEELSGDGGVLDVEVMAARWSGHYDAQAGHFYDDLFVVSPLANSVKDYGYVFAGDVIRGRAIGVPLSSADALLNLNLFTSTVSTGLIEAPLPTREVYGDAPFTLLTDHTQKSTGTVADASFSAPTIDGQSTNGTGVIFYDGAASPQNRRLH